MLEIKNLHVEVKNTGIKVLQGLNLCIGDSEISAIMGPNGSGKSTLSYIITGKEEYKITKGDIFYNKKSILSMSIVDRANLGIFLAFQYPIEISGLSTIEFLKHALYSQRMACKESPLSPSEFLKYLKKESKKLGIEMSMLKRSLNFGFSGGEKKKLEVLQMKLLKPKLCILDETDSGLDIDALKTVADGVNTIKDSGRSFVIITHYQRLLQYIIPDTVHVLYKGKIIKSGDKSLALYLEKHGYNEIIDKFL